MEVRISDSCVVLRLCWMQWSSVKTLLDAMKTVSFFARFERLRNASITVVHFG